MRPPTEPLQSKQAGPVSAEDNAAPFVKRFEDCRNRTPEYWWLPRL